MRKVSRIISLLLALLIGAGCIGALAQEPVAQESEMIVQDNDVQEAEKQAEQETAEPEDVEPEAEEQPANEADEQETADHGAAEKEEPLNEIPPESVPSEREETDDIENGAEKQPAAVVENAAGSQEANSTTIEEAFTANVSIELANMEKDIHLGDDLQLQAVIDGANRSYVIAWQIRELPTPFNDDPEWKQIEKGETYQFILTEKAAKLEYRVLLIADNGQIAVSEDYRLPEPAENDEPYAEPASGEEKPSPAVEVIGNDADSENHPGNGDQEETANQADEEELVIVPEMSPENTDTPDEEDRDLELAWNEIVVVTETEPETGVEPEVSDQSGEEPEVTDHTGGESPITDENEKEPGAPVDIDGQPIPDENGKKPDALDQIDGPEIPDGKEDIVPETLDENGEDQEMPENNGDEVATPEETGIDSQTLAENGEEPQQKRKVRVLSSRGETIVCGETIRMAADLSDFEDCAQVSVVWEADKGSGWEEVGTGENFGYIASAESIFWLIRARVRYIP